MTSLPSLPERLSHLTPREAITDTLNRCLHGLDTNDIDLFTSAFTQTATMKLNEYTSEGIQAIKADCFDRIAKLDTTHHVTNIRIAIDTPETKAAATASVIAHHFRSGEGMEPDKRGLLTGAFYYVDFVRGEDGSEYGDGMWRIERFLMQTSWREGDMRVLTSD
ncbi:hypothetical protein BDV18DRAFT_163984 [Aspergillus unguis]